MNAPVDLVVVKLYYNESVSFYDPDATKEAFVQGVQFVILPRDEAIHITSGCHELEVLVAFDGGEDKCVEVHVQMLPDELLPHFQAILAHDSSLLSTSDIYGEIKASDMQKGKLGSP